MTRRKWVLLVALFILPGIAAILFVLCVAAYFILSAPPTKTFEVRDPNSPTVVRVTGGSGGWTCVISADGSRRTQFAGWPTNQIAAGAEPTAMVWHGDPDWVEIFLSSGERLKLTWDTEAAERARGSREPHSFLNPRYEVLPGH